MAFDPTKHDVEINGVGYRVRGYSKSEVESLLPRISPSNQTESDFTLLQSQTIEFEGGNLQRFHRDDSSIYGSENMHNIYDDGVLYPLDVDYTANSGFGSSRPTVTALGKTNVNTYIASKQTTGSLNTLVSRINAAGTISYMTTPASLNSDYTVTDITVLNGEPWLTARTSAFVGKMFRYSAASTFTEVAGGSGAFYKFCVWNNAMYGVGGSNEHIFYKYTGSNTSRAFTELGRMANNTDSPNAKVFVFNNRVMVCRNDGMYAYDGNRYVVVDDASDNVDEDNYRLPVVWRGYIYYFMPDGFYRYNGSLIEKIYDVTEVGRPYDMCVGKNRLWIGYNNSAAAGSSRYDKGMNHNYSTGTSFNHRIAVFTGKAYYTYLRTGVGTRSGTPLIANEGDANRIWWHHNRLFQFNHAEPNNFMYVFRTLEEEADRASVAKGWSIVTSIYDAGFPMVSKACENVEIVLDGDVDTSELITIEYRSSGFDGSGSWLSFGTFNTTTQLKRLVTQSLAAGLSFRSIQFKLSGSTSDLYGIKQFIIRYMMMPQSKWQWQFSVISAGDGELEPLRLRDGSIETQSNDTLRGALYQARQSYVPIKYIDIDYMLLNGAINAAVTSVVVHSTNMAKSQDGFIQIDDEVMYYYNDKTSTTFTVVRGQLGTVAASHSSGARVHLLYRVFARRLPQERIEVDDSLADTTAGRINPSEMAILLQEV